jgi:hypothetical protein
MKNKLTYAILTILLIGSVVACKKNDDKLIDSSSLIIVNAVSGAGILVPNFQADTKLSYYKLAQQIPAYSSTAPFFEFPSHIGTFPLSLSLFTDTLNTLFKGNVTMEPKSIHTLFLSGTLTTVDTAFTTDNIPAFAAADSLIGVRFINVSKGSNPLAVNIKGVATPFLSNLTYKSVSGFVGYSAKKVVPAVTSYAFEIRDPSAANKLIATYTLTPLTTRLGKSITVALRGIQGGTGVNAQAVFAVNNY